MEHSSHPGALSMAIAEAASVDELLDEIGLLHTWSESEAMTNRLSWLVNCKKLEDLRPALSSGEWDKERLATVDMRHAYHATFVEWCADFVAKFDPEWEAYLTETRSHGVGPDEIWDMSSNELHQLLRNREVDAALRKAGDVLIDALARLNEHRVLALLNQLAVRELLTPPIADDRINSHVLYWGTEVTRDVAAVLICNEIGGCNGADHPMVLRQCVMRYDSGVPCYQPADIHEAVYQTRTPLEYQAFQLLLYEAQRLMARSRQR